MTVEGRRLVVLTLPESCVRWLNHLAESRGETTAQAVERMTVEEARREFFRALGEVEGW